MRKNTLNFLLVLALIGVAGYVGKNYQTWFPPEEVSSSEISEEPSSEVPSEEPSEEQPVLLEQYQLVFNKEQNFYISLRGPGITGVNENTFGNGNIVSALVTSETFTFTFSPIDLQEEFYLRSLIISGTGISSVGWTFLNDDGNEVIRPFGIYDFSEIVITEEGQVLNPIYTPIYL